MAAFQVAVESCIRPAAHTAVMTRSIPPDAVCCLLGPKVSFGRCLVFVIAFCIAHNACYWRTSGLQHFLVYMQVQAHIYRIVQTQGFAELQTFTLGRFICELGRFTLLD